MAEYTDVFVPGRVYWTKIIGNKALHDNYDGDGREWSYELVPDDTSFLKEHRLLDRLKDKEDEKNPDKGEYLYLKKPELNKDGDKNDPIHVINNDPSVTDDEGNQVTGWDGRLIGNGTRVVAKLTIADWGKGKKKSIWTKALRVDDLVPYEGKGGSSNPFGDYDSPQQSGDGAADAKTGKRAAKPKTKAAARELDDLDDDMPF